MEHFRTLNSNAQYILATARLAYRIRSGLRANFEKRQEQGLPLDKWLTSVPVPPRAFSCQRQDRGHFTLQDCPITRKAAQLRQLIGSSRNTKLAQGREIWEAVGAYRARNQLNRDIPAGQNARLLRVTMSRRLREVAEFNLTGDSGPKSKQELEDKIKQHWEFRSCDNISSMTWYKQDGSSMKINTDDDIQQMIQTDNAVEDLRFWHTFSPTRPEHNDQFHHCFYPREDITMGKCRMGGGVCQYTSEQELAASKAMVEREHQGSKTTLERAAVDPAASSKSQHYAQQDLKERQAAVGLTTTMDDEQRQVIRRTRPRYSNAELAAQELPGFLQDPSILQGMSLREGVRRRRVSLMDHQLTGLFFLMEKERETGGGIIADKPGLGKTLMMIAAALTSNQMWAKSEKPITKPTLLAVASTTADQIAADCYAYLGSTWRVFRYGSKEHQPWQKTGDRLTVRLRPNNPAFDQAGNNPISQHLIIMTHEQASRILDGPNSIPPDTFKDLIDRLLVDEFHMLRFAETTKRGMFLKKLNVRVKHDFTGTMFVAAVLDFRGYVLASGRDVFVVHDDFKGTGFKGQGKAFLESSNFSRST